MRLGRGARRAAAVSGLGLVMAATAACGGDNTGRLQYVPTESRAMRGAQLSYGVYLPPGFDAHDRLPLVILLHGGGDEPRTFDRWDVGEQLDRAIDEGRMPPCVIVLPQGDDGFWIDWHDHSRMYETWILEELIPEVRERYHTQSCPDGCHVMGMSMGGFGTLSFAIHHPEHFDSATIISAPILDTEAMLDFRRDRLIATFIPMHRMFGPTKPAFRVYDDDPYRVWAEPGDPGVDLFIAWGTNDRGNIRKASRKFVDHLRERDIAHEALEFEGGHSWVSWTPVIERALAHQLD